MPNAECRMPNAECRMPNAKCARSSGIWPSISRIAISRRTISAMSRVLRVALLVVGACVLAVLVWRIGPALILDLLRRIGWRFFVVALLYALHLAVRGYAIWRVLPRAALRSRKWCGSALPRRR